MVVYNPRHVRDKKESDLKGVWTAIVLKAVFVIFLAGVSWERLSALETAIRHVSEAQVYERLAVIEAKLDQLLSQRSRKP